VSVLLFQCARELVVNLIKHADATGGDVLLQSQGEELILTIEDDGRGFASGSTDEQPPNPRGYGLFGIRERLRLFGDRLDINGCATLRPFLQATRPDRFPGSFASRTWGTEFLT
jgi:signal transduction histidine kinase